MSDWHGPNLAQFVRARKSKMGTISPFVIAPDRTPGGWTFRAKRTSGTNPDRTGKTDIADMGFSSLLVEISGCVDVPGSTLHPSGRLGTASGEPTSKP